MVLKYFIYFVQNLERYLEKTFKDQHFLPETTLIRSTEDNIELQIPTNIEGYKVTTNIGCKVSCKKKKRGKSLCNDLHHFH